MTLRRGYVDTSWGQVHYLEHGEGPVCAFFHESPQSVQAFEQTLPLMSGIRAIAFDTPGYGNSAPPPRDGFEIPDYSARLLEAIDGLGVDSFAVSGVHTGASIALEVGIQAGMDRTSHAVLTGVPLFSEEERADFLANWAPKMTPAADGSHLGWAWERYQRVWGEESPPEMLHLAAVHILAGLHNYDWAYNAAFRYDPAPHLSKLTCPTLLLDAENDMLAKFDQPSAQLLPDARIEHLPGLRGQLPLRVPELYARHVVDFVTS